MKKVATCMILAVGAASPAFAVDCSSFPNNTITTFINEDVFAYDVTCTVGRTGYVNGNLYQSGLGNLIVRGRVNGGIEEAGAGGISLLAGSRVNGEVTELDAGNVLVRGGSTLGGDVKEYGAGSIIVNVDLPGVINGNLYEHGKGNVAIRTIAGDFNGNVYEQAAGDIVLTIASGTVFNGASEERDLGSLEVYVDGRYEGNLTELDAGDLSTAGSGVVNGNSEHELPGRCTNTVRKFEGAACNLL